MVLHPNMSAVEAVERFASDFRFAGTWERIARILTNQLLIYVTIRHPQKVN